MQPKQAYLARKYKFSQSYIARILMAFKEEFRKALEVEGYYS